MTRTPTHTGNPAAPSIDRLRIAVRDMDAFAHEGFSQIAAIAEMALSHLEADTGGSPLETITHALRVIQGKAEMQDDCIHGEAHDVGCAYIDAARMRRIKSLAARAEGGGLT